MFTFLMLSGSLALGQAKASEALPPPTPVAELPSINDCLGACTTPNDPAPFLRAPILTPLDKCKDGSGCNGMTNLRADKSLWRHTFHHAARFTFPRFAQDGEQVDADGVVIYEGMRLTVNRETGIYDLSFTATTPPTPVTIRLQLIFHPPEEPEQSVRLTLPPNRDHRRSQHVNMVARHHCACQPPGIFGTVSPPAGTGHVVGHR